MDPLNLDSQNQANNIPVVLPSFPIEIGKSVRGFMSYDRIYEQTNRADNFMYIYIDTCNFAAGASKGCGKFVKGGN